MRWLHLSDIHYDPRNSGRATEQLRDKLPAYIAEKGIKADRLFVTGDFRHARYQKEDQNAQAARDAAAFILRIAKAAGVTPEHIDLVPGNHDLARAEDTAGTERIERIRDGYHVNKGRFSPEDAAFLLDRFAFFRAVQGELEQAGYRSPWKENAARLDGNPDKSPLHAVRILDDCALLCLNTSILCNSDQDRGQLLIGNYDLYQSLKAIRERNSDKPIIVLAHHGLDNFRDDEKKAVERLFKDFPVTLYLCGDAHETWQRTTNGFYELTMGCLTWGKGVQIVFSTGELPAKALPWRVTAHEWDERYNCWDEYRHFNRELEDSQRGVSSQRKAAAPKAEIVTLERSARPSGAFVGREDKIQEIEQAFQNGETAVVLYGMGGIGKSEICRKLFWEYANGGRVCPAGRTGWLMWRGTLDSFRISKKRTRRVTGSWRKDT